MKTYSCSSSESDLLIKRSEMCVCICVWVCVGGGRGGGAAKPVSSYETYAARKSMMRGFCAKKRLKSNIDRSAAM